MKKIYYILACAVLAFSACQKEPTLQSTTPIGSVQNLNVTLAASDYGKLTSGYPKTSLSFDNLADANTYVPQILAAEYKTAANNSTAAVTYTVSSLYFKSAADSLYSDIYYKLTSSDYGLDPNLTNYGDFSIAQAILWLPYKYTTPKTNQLSLLSFVVYPTTQNPPPPYSFLYFNSAWRQIYTIQPAQYAAVSASVGKYDQFTASNTESSLVSTFNFFLKNDITIMDTVKKNDLIFVSFDYYATNAYQRVKPLEFDGNNFVVPYSSTSVATFVKANGTWKPEPVVSYTLTSADITLIGSGAAGTAAAKANLNQYLDFDSSWATADMDAAVIECLLVDIKTPAQNTLYKITFPNYSSPAPNPLGFIWDGAKWVAQQ